MRKGRVKAELRPHASLIGFGNLRARSETASPRAIVSPHRPTSHDVPPSLLAKSALFHLRSSRPCRVPPLGARSESWAGCRGSLVRCEGSRSYCSWSQVVQRAAPTARPRCLWLRPASWQYRGHPRAHPKTRAPIEAPFRSRIRPRKPVAPIWSRTPACSSSRIAP